MMGVIALSHLAPFSYINRGTLTFFALAWTVMHILSTNKGFGKINMFNAKYRNIRSCIAWLTILALNFCLVYDIMNTYVKYREGFLITGTLPNGNVFVKPAVPTQWTAGDLALLPAMTELLNLAFTAKSSAHFLGLAFWSTMAKKNFGATFGSSTEFMAYKTYSVISIILYPIAQFTAPTETLSIIEPQLVYACENVVVMVLILAVNHRLVGLLKSSSLSFDIQNRMKFYIAVNRAQFFFVLLEFLGLGSINIDQASKSNLLFASPFWTDFCTHFFDIGFPMACVTLIIAIFPNFNDRHENQSGGRGTQDTGTRTLGPTAQPARKEGGVVALPSSGNLSGANDAAKQAVTTASV
ncbi:unnamed protein product (mitochondrion) [Plasmodiophora brassicae]|uniref:THH1/TOM1/TOM3 domain-containing protein n=1 Tax=Plasmodiophora brassicae TaxID=37360 RepID=A0A0G4ILP6_PLABS|nr:hypothetical protein PBRA_004749 [Plasmodiophora brassicae]SPQ93397.1 unnamed protein product [Plasmodiophora brassicae]